MKKIIIFLVVGLIVCFSTQLTGQVKQNHPVNRLMKHTKADNMGSPCINPADEKVKWEHYLLAKNWKTQKHSRHTSVNGPTNINNPQNVSIDIVENSDHWQPDADGYLVFTAACHNSGSTGVTGVRVDIKVYDSENVLLGTDYNYIWGGTNVRLGNGDFTNALRSDEEGFFRIWTYISYEDAYSLTYEFTYDIESYSLANASLDFFTSVYYANDSGYLNFYGEVENQSTAYVTYHTIVAMAALDTTATYVLDVDWNYVYGAPFDSSNSAIYPGTSQPFDITFQLAHYNQSDGDYMAAFEWDEALTYPDVEYPFGAFETPTNNSIVASSIAVTGWALDDSAVENVKIYREAGNDLAYIGDAIFVDGARPDVADAFPDYPLNTRAGWGYMMLTNFLPNNGNGTFVLHAIATDVYGKSTDLGTKTIYCDNAHAVKPFGAIDTPASGGTASGSQYQNIGWVLTPPPHLIPKNGSTIRVYVDGIKKGNVTYNLYRQDIANLFPGYNNSNGAMGRYLLNTLPYSNGLHTIFWVATDNGGNTDGIGSRYFTISNELANPAGLKFKKAVWQLFKPMPALIDSIPNDVNGAPVLFKKGYRDDILARYSFMGPNGASKIIIQQLERVELQIPNLCTGYLEIGDKYKPLPVGSTLDIDKETFIWQPGPAFMGDFNLVFILKTPDGAFTKKTITIAIKNK